MRSSERRGARERLRGVRSDLRRGLWVKAGPSLWRRVGSGPLPGHASSTKGTASLSRRRPVLARLGDLREAFFVMRGPGGATAAVAAHDGGTVLFDVAAHRVIRRYGSGPVTDEYIRMRTVFTSHVGAPAFVVGEDGEFLVEELISGEHLLDVAPGVRVTTIRRLISDYARLAADAGVGGAGLHEILAHVIAAGGERRRPLPQWDEVGLEDIVDGMTWMPSAYEATAKNLIVSRGPRPVPIDLGDLQNQPFFAYPLGVLMAAGRDVLDAFFVGEFDAELAELWAAAGVRWSSTRAQRRGALIARAAFAAVRDHDAGVPGGFAALFEHRLEVIDPWLRQTEDGGIA